MNVGRNLRHRSRFSRHHQQKLLIGQQSRVIQSRFADIRVSSREQYNRLRRRRDRRRKISPPAIVRIKLVMRDLPYLPEGKVSQRRSVTYDAVPETRVKARLKHLHGRSQMQLHRTCQQRRPARRQSTAPVDLFCQPTRQAGILQVRMQGQSHNIPPIHTETILDATHANRKQIAPNLRIFNLKSEVVNAGHRAAERRALFVVIRSGRSGEIDNPVPLSIFPRAAEIVFGM